MMNISDKYSQHIIRVIMRMYPSLFHVKINALGEFTELYFTDKNISKNSIYIDDYAIGILSLYTEDNTINLKIQTSQQIGLMRMVQDFKFPLETSIKLFEMGIDICYKLYNDTIAYDKEVIRRQYIIENIINHES